MPRRAPRPCAQPGCPALVHRRDRRYCETHHRQRQAEYDRQRGTSAQRGYGSRWRRLRQMVLAEHPLCADPYGIHAARGEVVAATDVDHIKPKRDGGTDDWDNLQALCSSCHSRKTIDDGRWGGGD